MHIDLLLTLLGTAACASALDLEKYRFRWTPEYTRADNVAEVAGNLRLRAEGEDYVEAATRLVKGIVPEGIEFRLVDDHYVGDNGVGHVYFKQTVHGVDVDNAIFNVNIGQDGTVFSYGNSFFTGDIPQQLVTDTDETVLDAVSALKVALDELQLPITVSGNAGIDDSADSDFTVQGISGTTRAPEAKQVYVLTPEGKLALTWKIKTVMPELSLSSYVAVEEAAADLVGVVSHSNHATYQVYEFPINDPREGIRTIVEDPLDPAASKLGWHGDQNDTFGNNVEVGALPQSGLVTTAHSDTFTFEYPYEPDTAEDPWEFREASVTQAFYVTNMLHDLYWILGFGPAQGNFQFDNGDEGGLGRDPVRVYVQTWSGMNNGVFSQEPDGRSPTLTMYNFDFTDPQRDGGFDSGFLIHEYSHGMSDRMTGGPLTEGCLNDWEADGMAEGWSDLFAAAITMKPDETRENATYGFAAWPTGKTNPPTARLVMYSTNMEINNFTYSTINGFTRVHEVGTSWATMLYEVMWNLIDKYGKNDNPRPDFENGVPTDGKFLMLKLLIDAFAIQPCNPTFVQARDAIVDADKALTGGTNACEIWTGFAKRGLGALAEHADSNRQDNFDLPDGVC